MSVCPSVCLSTPKCTTLYGRVLAYPSMDVVFIWHMERTYIGAFWGLSVIIDGSLYGRVLAYPSMDFVLLWHMEQTYIGAVLRRIIFEKSQKLKFWRFFEKL